MRDVERVKNAVYIALGAVYKNEFRLIKQQCHELNIVGAFYHYFRMFFGEQYRPYCIDMEYSRQGAQMDPKEIDVNNLNGECSYCHRVHKRRVRSDFIVHVPGEDKNLLVVEFKGGWSTGCLQWDKKKLQALTIPKLSCSNTDKYVCGYQLGVSIVLKNEKVELRFYPDSNENGKFVEMLKEELIGIYESFLSNSDNNRTS